MNTLKAERRDLAVKAKRLRSEGYVTGNVFGKEIEGSIPVKMHKSDVEKLLKKCNKGSQIQIEIDGQSRNVLIKELQYNTIRGRVDEMDFQALVSGETVHSVAEIILHNRDKVQSGILQQHLEEIAYKALPEYLVDRVEIDCSSYKIGDVVRVSDLDIAKNEHISLMTDPETEILSVNELHAKAVAAEETAEETAEPAAE